MPKGEKFRMINNLSYPRGDSINTFISDQDSRTEYERFDRAVEILLKHGQGAFMFKADIKSAFRNIPIHPDDFCLFGVQFEGEFYVDRNLCFGLRTSCRIFEEVATFLQWVVVKRTSRDLSHY